MATRELRPRPQPQPNSTGGISTKKKKAKAPSYSTKKKKAKAPTFLQLINKSRKSHVDWLAEAKKVFNGTTLVNNSLKSIKDSQEAREEIMSTIQEGLGVEDPKAAVEMLLTGDLEARFVAKIAEYVYIKIKEVLKFTLYLLSVEIWDVEIAGLISDTIKTEISEHLGFEVSELKSLADLAEEVHNDTSRWRFVKGETPRNRVQSLQCKLGNLEDIVNNGRRNLLRHLAFVRRIWDVTTT